MVNEKEEYNSGTETLKIISTADNFNQWMYQTVKPFCKGHILEIGSGIGNISRFLLSDGFDVTLSDINNSYFDILNKKFEIFENLKELILFDFAEKKLRQKYPQMIEKYDSVIALNVLEHIDDQGLAIENSLSLIKPGGNLIILVPAFQSLYNQFDIAVEHYRRYSVKSLHRVMSKPGFEILQTRYFNVAGILGWYVSGKIFHKDVIPGGQMGFYDKLVPLWKIIDRLFGRYFGLSLICIARRTIN